MWVSIETPFFAYKSTLLTKGVKFAVMSLAVLYIQA